MIKVLVIEPEKKPAVREIEDSLESLQGIVGGYIECIYPFDDPVGIICNDEGKLNGLPLNRALRDKRGNVYDVISGTFIVAGLTEDDFGSLSDDLLRKYAARFFVPEVFMKIDGKLAVLPLV